MPFHTYVIPASVPPLAVVGLGILFLFLPGFLLWRVLLVRSERFRQFCSEEYGFWTSHLVQMAASVLITGSVGFALGELGFFNLVVFSMLIGVVCIVLLILGDPRKMWRFRGYGVIPFSAGVQDSSTRKAPVTTLDIARKYLRLVKNLINNVLLRNEALYIPVLLVIALFMFTKPIQNVWRGRSDGAEALCAIRLARNESFRAGEPLVGDIAPEHRQLLFGMADVKGGSQGMARFPSYFSVSEDGPPSSYPTFLHFHSVWLGLSCLLADIPNLYYVTPVLAAISIGVVFIFIKCLSSVKTAFLAILLLTLNVMQIYFVRFSSSAITAQLLVFTGLYFFMVFSRTALRTFGVLSGVAFAQAALCQSGILHYLLLAGFLAFCATYTPRKRTRIRYAYAILPFLLFMGQVAIFDFIAGTGNMAVLAESLANPIVGESPAREVHLGRAVRSTGIFLGVMIIISAASLIRRRAAAGPIGRAISAREGIVIRSLGYLLILFYLVWFYSTHPPYLTYEGGTVYPCKWVHKTVDEMGLLFLAIGIVFLLYFRFYSKRHHVVYFPTFLYLIFSLEGLWNTGGSSVLPYGFRGFIPLFLPFSYFLIAYSLFAFRELTRDLEFGRYFGGTIAIASIILILLTAQSGLLLKSSREEKNLSADVFEQYQNEIVSKLARADIPADTAVFFFAPGSRDPLVPMTLTYVYGIQSIELSGDSSTLDNLPAVIADIMGTGKNVFLVVQSGERVPQVNIDPLKTIPFGEARISVARVAETQGERIRKIATQGQDPTLLTILKVVNDM